MIDINLKPYDDSSYKRMWLYDILIILIVGGAGLFLLHLYNNNISSDISLYEGRIIASQAKLKELHSYALDYDYRDEHLHVLQEKIAELRYIKISPLERYKPVILIEHLQNLLPPQIWLSSIKYDDYNSSINVKGMGYNNLIISKFMHALKSTQSHDFNENELRSQVYFSDINILNISVANDILFPYLKDYPQFHFKVNYATLSKETIDGGKIASLGVKD